MAETTAVVWFKRDFRVCDHAPLAQAAARARVLPLYIVEPAKPGTCQPISKRNGVAFKTEMPARMLALRCNCRQATFAPRLAPCDAIASPKHRYRQKMSAPLPASSRPVLLALAGISLLCIMDALIKQATLLYPVFQATFLRFLLGTLAALLAVAVVRPGFPTRETVMANAWRSVLVAGTGLSFFYAISVLPLSEGVALSFSSPIFMALLAALILGEKVDARIGLALVAGGIGTGLIVSGRIAGSGYSDAALHGVAAAIISALTYALAMVLLRARAQRDAILHIVLFHSLGPSVLLAAPAFMVWQPLAMADVPLFLAIGTLGFAGHVLLSSAFRAAAAARLAPLEYIGLVWAIVYRLPVVRRGPHRRYAGGRGADRARRHSNEPAGIRAGRARGPG